MKAPWPPPTRPMRSLRLSGALVGISEILRGEGCAEIVRRGRRGTTRRERGTVSVRFGVRGIRWRSVKDCQESSQPVERSFWRNGGRLCHSPAVRDPVPIPPDLVNLLDQADQVRILIGLHDLPETTLFNRPLCLVGGVNERRMSKGMGFSANFGEHPGPDFGFEN